MEYRDVGFLSASASGQWGPDLHESLLWEDNFGNVEEGIWED